MESLEQLGKEYVWKKFIEESPEFSNPKSNEYKVLEEVYQDEFQKSVDTGKLTYKDAIEQARERATQRLGFEEIRRARTERPTGPTPQFKGVTHPSASGKASW